MNRTASSQAVDTSAQLFIDLHTTLAVLIRKNRFVRRLTHTGLSRAEIHVLVEIDAREASTIKELRPLLGMDQSSVSRLVKGLTTAGHIRSSPSKRDKRVKELRLSATGRKVLKEIDRLAGQVFKRFRERLSKAESKILLEFFRDISDYYGQPECPIRNGENEMRMQQRRMSRAIGVLSKDLFGSKLSSAQWHVFYELCHSRYPLNPTQISKSQGIPPNSLTVIFEKLESKGYIARAQAHHDSRFVELHATTKGRKYLDRVQRRCAAELAEVMQMKSEQEIQNLLSIFTRYVDQELSDEEPHLGEEFSVKIISDEKLLKQARELALNELVRRGHAEFAPAHIASDTCIVYGLYLHKKELLGMLQFSQEHKDLTLLASTKSISPRQGFLFLKGVLDRIAKESGVGKVNVDFEPAARLLKKGALLKQGTTVDLRAISA